ncbi:MAG TPA: hypothetical protein VII30_11415, partial [Gemmatimonadaceae bacterium]
LAAAATRQAASGESNRTMQTRIDLRAGLSPYPTTLVLADRTGRCICRDPVYVRAYGAKYGESNAEAKPFAAVLHANGHN